MIATAALLCDLLGHSPYCNGIYGERWQIHIDGHSGEYFCLER